MLTGRFWASRKVTWVSDKVFRSPHWISWNGRNLISRTWTLFGELRRYRKGVNKIDMMKRFFGCQYKGYKMSNADSTYTNSTILKRFTTRVAKTKRLHKNAYYFIFGRFWLSVRLKMTAHIQTPTIAVASSSASSAKHTDRSALHLCIFAQIPWTVIFLKGGTVVPDPEKPVMLDGGLSWLRNQVRSMDTTQSLLSPPQWQ